MQLSFENLRAANVKRGAQWDGKPAALDDLSFRAMELGGECGEALNVAKKLVRQLSGRVGGLTLEQARPMLAEELADVIICADRVAEVLGIDLPTAITEKFNKTSLKHGLVLMQECMTSRACADERRPLLERALAHARGRWDWWQKNAEAIAKERGELFRAGEALRHVVQEKTFGCTEVAVWDAAAQPIRDMVADFSAPKINAAGDQS